MMRVREVLNNSEHRAVLRGKLPPDAILPSNYPRVTYPQPILNLFNATEKYSMLGWITEYLFREPDINRQTLDHTISCFTTKKLPFDANVSKYLAAVKQTANIMKSITTDPLQVDTVVTGMNIQGHPDFRTKYLLFEVKTSGRLTEYWTQFLLQLFSYGALDTTATHVHLVLPLQGAVWSYNLSNWTKRDLFRRTLEECVSKSTSPQINPYTQICTSMILSQYPIGSHIRTAGTLSQTLMECNTFRDITTNDLPSDMAINVPYQIFMGGAASTKVNISDSELAQSCQVIAHTNLSIFVHVSHLINLCKETEYGLTYMNKIFSYAKTIGAKGVVIHVGKRCKIPIQDAMNQMTLNLLSMIEFASQECPLLLETPSGQGTEVLTQSPEEFNQYCERFNDSRFGICIDTCHVFVNSMQPSEYLRRSISHLIKLIHFNDSAKPFGSRVDRHAMLGTGCIDIHELNQMAQMCTQLGIPMLRE